MLAWISDRDGRPRAWIGALPPAGPEDATTIVEPDWPLPTDLDDPDLPPGDVQALSWSPDGSWLACQLAPGGGERTRVLLVSPDGTGRREIAPGAAAVTLGSWSPGGRQLGVTVYPRGDGGDGQAFLVDLRDGTSTVLASGPAAKICAISGDGRRVVVRLGRRGTLLLASEGPTVPRQLARIGLEPDRPSLEAHVLLPAAPPEHLWGTLDALVGPTLHEFPGEDGLTLSGWLFRPRTALGAAPTLIWLHGGPEAQERPTFQPLFQALVAEGVAVFAPNVRGSGGFGRSFSQADDHERRFAAITDVRAAVTFLTGSGLADPARIGVSGRSYGGYLTLAAMTWFPELFRVGVDVCGIADFETFYADTEPWIAAAATTKYGDPERDRGLLRELSPIHHIDRVAAPLLVVHGVHDTNVPLGEAERVVAALQERGVSPGFLLFDDEGHEVRGTANRSAFVREVVRWVSGNLLEVDSQTA
ncbi:S9 family peptidase [Pseudonocardia sp. H11422]|uniref:S9 family peptidase n=1 Tax=Pseudonocardia sp. H11422 TaxID=2835866 RepID=UPI001BDC1892|nr:prolyl oligopeptidase family serine peptidase [Pseudonocardia sp. H11422]